MNRRGFLQGVFGGVTAAGLIVAAKPDEIAAFSAPLKKDAPLLLDRPGPQLSAAHVGEHLYNERGEPVAIVSEVTVSAPAIDASSWLDTTVHYVSGLPEMEIRAIGIGRLERRVNKMPRLRGR